MTKDKVIAKVTDTLAKIEIDHPEALWQWLADHHQSTDSYLLITWKKSTPQKYVSREAVLDALLAYGWIDGRRYARDDETTMQLICQRKQQKWTKSYRDRIETLDKRGLLKAPGRAAVEAAKASGNWLVNEDVDQLSCPPDLCAALTAHQGLEWWHKSAPSYQRNLLRWLASAKTEQTRQKRCEKIAEFCAKGEKIPNY